MNIRKLSPELLVSDQLTVADVGVAATNGARSIVCNRPDGEGEGQPTAAEIKAAAEAHGLGFAYLPVKPGAITESDVADFCRTVDDLPGPVLAYCRTGTRAATLWALSKAPRLSVDAILETAKEAGYDLSGMRPRLEEASGKVVHLSPAPRHDVVIVGGGAGGISTAASLLRRRPGLDIAIIEPREEHYYQPGWTLVGGGVFKRADTMRPMASAMPKKVRWVRSAVAGFRPDRNEVVLEDGARIGYRALVVSPGLKLDWEAIDGLPETLGKNGVTSNYLYDMAPYTWELVSTLKSGKAIFSQPPMPIKCAGAPQKAMYLSGDAWRRNGRLKDIDIEFANAGGVLFGVSEYVPALQEYIEKYGVTTSFNTRLVAVDGPAKTATFEVTNGDEKARVEKQFDMLHVVPPQKSHDFVACSPLANAAGWVEVDNHTLQHVRYGDVFGLGDACSAPNAKTAAAARKQAPVVAENVLSVLGGKAPRAVYDGYGSCPLTVERGKIVLAEFTYGGKLAPSLPSFIINGLRPSRLAWLMKEKMLPWLYWNGMFKGREWMAEPEILPLTPAAHESAPALDSQPLRKAS